MTLGIIVLILVIYLFNDIFNTFLLTYIAIQNIFVKTESQWLTDRIDPRLTIHQAPLDYKYYKWCKNKTMS